MSAIRTSQARGKARSALSSPYARRSIQKSSWSLGGFLSFLNPLRSRSHTERSLSPEVEEGSIESVDGENYSTEDLESQAVERLVRRGEELSKTTSEKATHAQVAASNPLTIPPPATPIRKSLFAPNLPNFQDNSSPEKNIETVSHFLVQKAGQTMSEVEVEGLISLLKKSSNPERQSPFRFSSSPSTPPRGNSPFAPTSSGTRSILSPSTPSTMSTQNPRKTLTRNPNGIYRWEGGGSARPSQSRNRYSSPAFGASRSTTERIVLKESMAAGEAPKTDTKRRRIGDDANSPSALPSGSTGASESSSRKDKFTQGQAVPFPSSITPATPHNNTASTAPNHNVLPSSSRLRTPGLQKPTRPVVPSPLRQAWSDGPSPSLSEKSALQTPTKPTKAANILAELIVEVTPPKKPDVSNPYQVASPVGKIGPPRRSKRPRATGRPAIRKVADAEANADKPKEEEKEKLKEYSPQAIIEATLPKGSKRSRPPAHFERSPSSSAPTSEHKNLPGQFERSGVVARGDIPYVIEELDDDDDEEKYQRTTKQAKPLTNGMASLDKSSPSQDILIEDLDDVEMQGPEKKESVQSGVSPIAGFGGLKTKSLPKEPSKLRFSYQPETGANSSSPVPLVPVLASEAKPPFMDHSNSANPFNFTPAQNKPTEFPKGKSSEIFNPKDFARSVPANSLPTFTFTATGVSVSSPSDHVKARKNVACMPISSLPHFDFSSLALKNSSLISTPTPKLDAPNPIAMPAKGFDWAAAGVKAPSTPSGASWTCSTCMLSNPASANEKCTICDTPR